MATLQGGPVGPYETVTAYYEPSSSCIGWYCTTTGYKSFYYYLRLECDIDYEAPSGRYGIINKVRIYAKLSDVLTMKYGSCTLSYNDFSIRGSSTTRISKGATGVGNLSTDKWFKFIEADVDAYTTADFDNEKTWSKCITVEGFSICTKAAYKEYDKTGSSYTTLSNDYSIKLSTGRVTYSFDSAEGSGSFEGGYVLAGNKISYPGSPTPPGEKERELKGTFYSDSAKKSLVSEESTTVNDTFEFTGWNDGVNDDNRWTSGDYTLYYSRTFTAKYKRNYASGHVSVPSSATKTGHSLTGWWFDGGDQAAGPTGNTKDFTYNTNFIAHWDADDHKLTIKYAVKVDDEYIALQDDTGKEEKIIDTEYGKTPSANLPSIWGYNTPTKVIDNSTGKEVDATKLSGDADNTYIAVYSPKINTIVFNLNQTGAKLDGVEMKSKTDTYTIRDGEIIKSISEDKKVINIFTKYRMECYIGTTTYCFLGWNTKADGSGAYISYLIPSDKNSVSSWGTTLNLYAQWLPLGKYVFYEGGWRGILNSWIYTGGTWKGWISGVDKKELITSNLTTWVRVKDPNDPEKLIWVKEYGNNRIS